jgi:hypothetical protein
MQTTKWVLTIILAASTPLSVGAGQGDGLVLSADSLPWSRWQARLAISQPAPLWRSGFGDIEQQGLKPRSLSLMGDYLLRRSLSEDGRASVLRATSGLVVGPRSTLWAGQPGGALGAPSLGRGLFDDTRHEPAALPYLGIGYSGLGGRGGWSVSADFGLMALGAGNVVRLGRAGGSQGLDDLVRELRLTPVLQVGASYAF